jgi:hypothetical protein
LVVAVLRALIDERWAPHAALRALDTAALRRVFDATVVAADEALVENTALLEVLGRGPEPMRAGELWRQLAEETAIALVDDALGSALRIILERGCLARRIVRRWGPAPSATAVTDVYRELADCLVAGRSFVDG